MWAVKPDCYYYYFLFPVLPLIALQKTVNGLPLIKFQYFLQIPSVLNRPTLDLSYQILANLYQDEAYSCATSQSPLLSFFCSFSSLSNPSSTFTSHSVRINHSAHFLGFIFNRTSQSFLSTCSVTIKHLPLVFGSFKKRRKSD